MNVVAQATAAVSDSTRAVTEAGPSTDGEPVLRFANSVHFGDWKSVPVAEGLVAFVLTTEGATASAGRLRRRVSRQVKSVRFCKRPTYSRSLVQCATSELTEARTSLLVSRTSSHDGDGLGVPPHLSFGRARPESSSRTETAPSVG
jgi:hypothetical protein